MMIDQRKHFMRFDMPIDPARGLDLGSVRFLREEAYAMRLANLPMNFVYDICRDGGLSPALLLRDGERVLANGVPPVAAESTVEQANLHMPTDWKLWERQTRHRYDVLVGVQNREVFAFTERGRLARYPAMPWWWQSVEVPFGLAVEAPEILAYKGIELRENPGSALWNVFRAEHAANCAAALVYEARRGRIWWVPRGVRDDMYELGLEACVGEGAADDARAVLREIELIRWSQVPTTNRCLPQRSTGSTPVFDHGDWVEFDVDDWESKMADEAYYCEGDWGFPEDGKKPDRDRGEKRHGDFSSSPQWAGHFRWQQQQQASASGGNAEDDGSVAGIDPPNFQLF